ncbi:molybdopterin synthase catalytic subunit MoaE [Paraglaciecola sp. 2405UD69-4]|uniref:molybdopterin synthase catalytic subunit MoaE n=1 Tax=Paraglaciecola sp. 2405UD69-4 TaxID=3391836 RepID=UPI0039C9479B
MIDANTYIKVQEADFSLAQEYQALITGNSQDGAVVTFCGLVRDMNAEQTVKSLFLEHYPGMTEKSLQAIIEQARDKWPLGRVRVVHRVGKLDVSEQIVFVGVTSQHRQAAFQGAEFIMDYLKVQAPFWKKESSDTGEYWVESKQSDDQKAKSWES